MNVAQIIKDYQSKLGGKIASSSIFLALANNIINSFPHRLDKKTYLLIPDPNKELMEISYEYLLSNSKVIPISLSLDISNIMNKFIEAAQKLGFTVITEMSEYNYDGELFDLLGTETANKGLIEEEINTFPGVTVPLTLPVDKFALRPFFPVVFKNITANRGEDKYLIENYDQFNKIMSLFELNDSKKLNLKNEFVVQEYIKGYDGINSSMRIFTSCTGDVLSSLFLVSAEKNPKNKVKNFGIDVYNPCEQLSDPNSQYYLNSKNIISNAAGGAKVIPLNLETNNINVEDDIMLTLHGINVETLSLPNDIIQQCKKVAQHMGTKKGIVLGIDFVYNTKNNKWYYLETNRNPSVEGYRSFMNLNGYLKKDVKSLMQLDSLMKIVENVMTKDIVIENTKRR